MRFTEPEDISSGRFDIYDIILESFKENMFFGHGTSSFDYLYAYGAHNIYLQLLYENGIFGLLLWIILFVKVLIKAFKRVFVNQNNFYDYLNVFMQVMYLTYAFFGNPLYNHALIIFYFVMIGYTYSKPIEKIGD